MVLTLRREDVALPGGLGLLVLELEGAVLLESLVAEPWPNQEDEVPEVAVALRIFKVA